VSCDGSLWLVGFAVWVCRQVVGGARGRSMWQTDDGCWRKIVRRGFGKGGRRLERGSLTLGRKGESWRRRRMLFGDEVEDMGGSGKAFRF